MKELKKQIYIKKLNHKFLPDSRRVITRYFYPGEDNRRVLNIQNRILALSEKRVKELLAETLILFSERHKDIKRVFYKHYQKVSGIIKNHERISEARKLLIGAYFTMEYSPASAALFNPSIVPHPDQKGMDEAGIRFIQSFRAVGEGHLSSILFTEGKIRQNGEIVLNEDSRLLETGTVSHLNNSVYEVQFNKDTAISSQVIFPAVENEKAGIEDARFVRFRNDNGSYTYYATYTAYDGKRIFPKLIETEDFKKFRITLLKGKGSQNKGMALFPEKINRKYTMISRGDNENLFLMYSDDLYNWENPEFIRGPQDPWEFIQIGNCGSPVKTDKGWLLLTHGVGPVRRYCMGVLLLDLKNPSRVIGRLPFPLHCPDESERNGYVPNVIYSCGSILWNGNLTVPYAASDTSSGIFSIDIDDLLANLY
ncbi:MAG: glycoside hydrolase family 130 protein [Spirochaetales bacterium]|nr:glycoside hydrolase family 130 protein [Spirochaetales bacterium]